MILLCFGGFLWYVVFGIFKKFVAQIIVFGRFGCPEKGYKNYQLVLICWLATGPVRLVGLVGWLMCLLLTGTEVC